MTVPKVHGVDKGVDPHVKPEHQKPRPQPEQKRHPPTAPNMPKKPCLPQACPQAHDQCLSHKLVERSRSILKQREMTNHLPRDKPPASNPPLSVPILPGWVHDQPDHPIHVPPFLSPAPVLQRPKALNEGDAEYDPLMDTDSPYDDALVEIEYRRPVDDDFTLPLSLEKQIEQGKLVKHDLP